VGPARRPSPSPELSHVKSISGLSRSLARRWIGAVSPDGGSVPLRSKWQESLVDCVPTGEKKKRVKRRNELDVVPYRQLKQSGVHCIS